MNDLSDIIAKLRRALIANLQGDLDDHGLRSAASDFESDGCPEQSALTYIVGEDTKRCAASLLRVIELQNSLFAEEQHVFELAFGAAAHAGVK